MLPTNSECLIGISDAISEFCLRVSVIFPTCSLYPQQKRAYSALQVKCCFTSTKTVGLLGTGAQDVYLDFHWVRRGGGGGVGYLCDARPKRSHPQKQARPSPPKQRIAKCWGASHCRKAACVLRNLSLSTAVGNKSQSQRQCPQRRLFKTTEATDRETHYARAQLHLPTHTDFDSHEHSS